MPFISFLLTFVIFFSASGCAIASGKLAYMKESDGQKQIYLAHADGSEAQPVTFGSQWHLYPALDGEAKWLAYVQGEDEAHLNIFLMELATGKVTALTQGEGQRLHPNFSRDGHYLAYANSEQNAPSQIVIVNLSDPQHPTSQTISSETPSYFPFLSQNGDLLIVQRSFADGTKRLVKRDLKTQKEEWLTESGRPCKHPSLSADDSQVVYAAKDGKAWNVFARDLRTGKETQLTQETNSDNLAPVFRKDGSVVFSSNRSGHFELFEITAEQIKQHTGESKVLLTQPGDVYAPTVGDTSKIKQGLLPPIPEPARSSFAATVIGNKLYVIGGHQGPEHTYPPESFLNRLESYDLSTGKWERLPDRPVASHGFAAVTHGKYLYVFGGFAAAANKKPSWQSLDLVDRYDTENKTWKTVAHLPRKRSSYIVQKMGTKAYLIGGWDSTPRFDNDYDGTFHREIDAFDCETETVQPNVASLPDPLRRAFTSVVLGDEIILVGGIGQGASHFDLLAEVTAYQPSTGNWRTLPALPFATFAPATGVLNGKIYVFGGMRKINAQDYEYIDNIIAFDGKSWADTGKKLHEAKGFSQVVRLPSGPLAILGGHASQADNDAPVRTAEIFGD